MISVSIQQFLIEAEAGNVTAYLEQEVTDELGEEYEDILKNRRLGLTAVLRKIYAKTKKKFIFLIDEWDCIMRKRQESETLQKQYLDFLRNLLKDQPYVALAYMTGILPVKKAWNPTELDLHSALNMFMEYSMTDQKALKEYTRFTEDEVKGLCVYYGMDFAEMGSWYDGYMLERFQHIYNP